MFPLGRWLIFQGTILYRQAVVNCCFQHFKFFSLACHWSVTRFDVLDFFHWSSVMPKRSSLKVSSEWAVSCRAVWSATYRRWAVAVHRLPQLSFSSLFYHAGTQWSLLLSNSACTLCNVLSLPWFGLLGGSAHYVISTWNLAWCQEEDKGPRRCVVVERFLVLDVPLVLVNSLFYCSSCLVDHSQPRQCVWPGFWAAFVPV